MKTKINTLHIFQAELLQLANKTTNPNSKNCYRDCVNFSGVVAYELRSKGLFSEQEAIKKTVNYQLTRFNVPKEVKKYFKSFPNDLPFPTTKFKL